MMIPPLIRIGHPPMAHELRSPLAKLVVLVRGRGWFIVQWSRVYPGALEDCDRHGGTPTSRLIDPLHVVCWMPEDGS